MPSNCHNCHKPIRLDEFIYCPYCGTSVSETHQTADATHHTSTSSGQPVALISGHVPNAEEIQFSLGPYQILKSIGKGGMGEVLLGYDTNCGRRIALKRIREDLKEHVQMHNRFLKEAHITSQLTHPSIIPIYTIHDDPNLTYYTMPFVEGKTLKQILKEARQADREGKKDASTLTSIPGLVRIFLSICQAVAYAHSNEVLHRDLKPENIIIGKYGEVLILDWGLAKMIRKPTNESEHKDEDEEDENGEEEESPEKHRLHGLTKLGKVVGTVSYMAPERALGKPATPQTDVYSLGVILYQILALRPPFRRGTLKEFRQNLIKEKLVPPEEVAPYRDVPRILSAVVNRCLSGNLDRRYSTVDEFIHDIENYLEGRSEWTQIAELRINRRTDWEFQENVLIAEHVAVTRGTEVTDWVSLMISKQSFNGNTRLETKVKLGPGGHGIGFLMSIPEAAERVHLNDGYCLWIGSDNNKSTKLLKSTVEVIYQPEIVLQRGEWYTVRIEKIDQNIYFYLNDQLQFSYICYFPLVGTHVGLLARDDDFTIEGIQISCGGQSIMVNCLTVPDTFLAHKNYDTAFNEYRRIGYSFPGTAEGREALFRAGITLLEQAKAEHSAELFDKALEEFGLLHDTPGAPLEYLGKGLVYETLQDFDEEIKCYELALRRYGNHPLSRVLNDHVIYRMLDTSRYDRKATYQFILLVLQQLPDSCNINSVKKLFNSLQKHWEKLPFFFNGFSSQQNHFDNFSIQLAFWLAKSHPIEEILERTLQSENPNVTIIGNGIFALIQLEFFNTASAWLEKIKDIPELNETHRCLQWAVEGNKSITEMRLSDTLTKEEERLVQYLLSQTIRKRQLNSTHLLLTKLEGKSISGFCDVAIKSALACLHMLENKWKAAEEIFQAFPLELLNQETTPLHFLYGCWLYHTEAKEIALIHFMGVLDVPYPRSWTLFSHYLSGKLSETSPWFQRAFYWEKKQLFAQLAIFYELLGNHEKTKYFMALEENEGPDEQE